MWGKPGGREDFSIPEDLQGEPPHPDSCGCLPLWVHFWSPHASCICASQGWSELGPLKQEAGGCLEQHPLGANFMSGAVLRLLWLRCDACLPGQPPGRGLELRPSSCWWTWFSSHGCCCGAGHRAHMQGPSSPSREGFCCFILGLRWGVCLQCPCWDT